MFQDSYFLHCFGCCFVFCFCGLFLFMPFVDLFNCELLFLIPLILSIGLFIFMVDCPDIFQYVCPECGASYFESDFCASCGADLVDDCICGRLWQSGELFCPSCGKVR